MRTVVGLPSAFPVFAVLSGSVPTAKGKFLENAEIQQVLSGVPVKSVWVGIFAGCTLRTC